MRQEQQPLRILYSFPHKLGADRICHTAWQQVSALAAAGAQVTVFPGAVHKPVDESIKVFPTLARGRFRIPYRLLGRMAACSLHDYLVSRRLERMHDQFDIVHTWPLGALRTLRTARKLGLPSALERPNSHTRFGYETVQSEAKRIGLRLPPGDEHEFNNDILSKEELEYAEADGLLCASDFVVKTFLDKGIPQPKLVRHIYGFDDSVFYPEDNRGPKQVQGLSVLFAGVGTVVKGLHLGVEAWLKSAARKGGKLTIAGTLLPAYINKFSSQLEHPSIEVVGQRDDLPNLMRKSDVLLLPSLTEGFALVIVEAMGSGCVPLASDACTDVCQHMQNSLVHHVGDVDTLSKQLSLLSTDRQLLAKLRAGALKTAPTVTWKASGPVLLEAYKTIIEQRRSEVRNANPQHAIA